MMELNTVLLMNLDMLILESKYCIPFSECFPINPNSPFTIMYLTGSSISAPRQTHFLFWVI